MTETTRLGIGFPVLFILIIVFIILESYNYISENNKIDHFCSKNALGTSDYVNNFLIFYGDPVCIKIVNGSRSVYYISKEEIK